MDKIIIRNLEVDTIIGIFEHERLNRQKVLINCEVALDLSRAGESDDFRDALNYSEIEQILYETAQNSQFLLVEKLASVMADKIMNLAESVQSVRITVDKPNAAKYAQSIAIEINRSRN
ncbi:MAG: dihydroneopterin aldolase [Lentisphaeria bacterium]|nr:dihydroneopterin aldolase [Lentisphaeria bacterium]